MSDPSAAGDQLRLAIDPTFDATLYEYGQRASGETHGVVLTHSHVVELILDQVGYTRRKRLAGLRLLEPACGNGSFLVPALARLLRSRQIAEATADDLDSAILAFDVDEDHVLATRTALREMLVEHGFGIRRSSDLVSRWVRQADFLLTPVPGEFDIVVGNPPYIRPEQVPQVLQREYRSRYSTLFDRADLYVAFIERALRLLKRNGSLGYICADRWILNRYGRELRRFVSAGYAVQSYIDLNEASPFESDVMAYPSIFVIKRAPQSSVRVARLSSASPQECKDVGQALSGRESPIPVDLYSRWFQADEPWTLSSPGHLAALRSLEEKFETLETDPGTRIGIGVATGCDAVFIVGEEVSVEPEVLLPLIRRKNLVDGTISWDDTFVLNPFKENGKLIDLARFPRLALHLEKHEKRLRSRYISKKTPSNWYRTIDRIWPAWVARPKLLIPDIAGSNEVTYDSGEYYPHHNLYFVMSDTWDLEVLGGLLSSRVALFFVWSYATKMRGGYLRFQAQYLRRIRVPRFESMPKGLVKSIRDAFRARDFRALDELALEAYGLDDLPEFDFVDTRPKTSASSGVSSQALLARASSHVCGPLGERKSVVGCVRAPPSCRDSLDVTESSQASAAVTHLA